MAKKAFESMPIPPVGKRKENTVLNRVATGEIAFTPTYQTNVNQNPGKWMSRLVIGHPMTGLVRVEWMMGRMGQIIPCNWHHTDIVQFMSPQVPLQYQISDAENLIAKAVIEAQAEWLLFWEQDNIPPNNAMVLLNEYMIEGKVPIVGGLYFTKSNPAEPILYRGFGNGYYDKWKLGDKVWVSGLPFGFTLIHASIIKALWDESPEYRCPNGIVTRRVFDSPRDSWLDEEKGTFVALSGTSDLAWCNRIMQNNIFEKAGWPDYAKKEYPFLVDTNIFVWHIDNNGVRYPYSIPARYKP